MPPIPKDAQIVAQCLKIGEQIIVGPAPPKEKKNLSEGPTDGGICSMRNKPTMPWYYRKNMIQNAKRNFFRRKILMNRLDRELKEAAGDNAAGKPKA